MTTGRGRRLGAAILVLGLLTGCSDSPTPSRSSLSGSRPSGSRPSGSRSSGSPSGARPSSRLVVRDTTTGVELTCSSVVYRGAVPPDPLAATGAALDARALSIGACDVPGPLKLTVAGHGTWRFQPGRASNGAAAGTLSNVAVHVGLSGPGLTCAFDLGRSSGSGPGRAPFTSTGGAVATVAPGALSARYDGRTREFSVTSAAAGALAVWNVNPASHAHSCVGPSILAQGDRIAVTATIRLGPAQ